MSIQSKIAADPWRLMFPLGVVLSWLGVSHWFFVWAGQAEAMGAFHAIAQIEGFVWCFVVGFLFTMVPRRTQSAPPGPVDLAVGALAPVAATFGALAGAFAASQTAWLIGAIALVRFVVVRVRRGARRPPPGMVWIPIAILIGVGGSVATGVGAAVPEFAMGHRLGKLLLTQGMVFGLVLGAGSVVVPLLTRGEPAADAGPAAWREVLVHVAAAVALVGTFLVEVFVDTRLGRALRAVLALLLVLFVLRLHRVPTLPGWNRWLVWTAAWCIPLGYALMAIASHLPQLGLHVVFVGGFAPLALAVGLHVTLAHAGRRDDAGSWSLGAALPVALLALAVAFRALAELDPTRWLPWLATAAATFLLATAAWLARAWPALRA